MMCCSDPDSVTSVALDFDRGGCGGWAYTDCDGLAKPLLCFHIADGPDFRTGDVHDSNGRRVGRLLDGESITIGEGAPILGSNMGPVWDLSTSGSITFEEEIPISGSMKSAEPLPTVWWYRRAPDTEWTLSKEYPNPTEPGSWEVVACTSARVEPIRFDNTQPEKVAAATGWPSGWMVEYGAQHRARRRLGTNQYDRVPNTERGRRAAWELEGA